MYIVNTGYKTVFYVAQVGRQDGLKVNLLLAVLPLAVCICMFIACSFIYKIVLIQKAVLYVEITE